METALIVLAVMTVPLAGIAMGGFKVWLEHRKEQPRLGAATEALEGTVETLSRDLAASNAERRRLEERIENLETIVTSRVWSATGTGTRDSAEARRHRADLEMTLADLPRDEPSPAHRTATLADEINS